MSDLYEVLGPLYYSPVEIAQILRLLVFDHIHDV